MIDLWTTVPTVVANVKGCHDARSVESSKFGGYEDAYVIEGCYWPPQYVVYDGLTLEPLNKVNVPMGSILGETLPEVRVAAIVASHNDPVWVMGLKESGYVGIVDYSQPGIYPDPGFPLSTIAAELFLHDGGFDHTGNYFLLAANASNKIVVIDLVTQTLAATIETGLVPHPGRGVNWEDPVFGWVNATSHISEGKVAVYSADPLHPRAWEVVREIPLPSAGSLFIKSYPDPLKAPYVLVDMTLSATGHEKDICAISKATGALAINLDVTIDPDGDGCFTVATNGRAVHFEFNKEGTEVWVADWDPDGAVIVLDSTTLTEIRRFVNLTTPTGKFNVFNTAHDIY
jgi:nitrite reductase (NO-forming)/hydroxylamine reductase